MGINFYSDIEGNGNDLSNWTGGGGSGGGAVESGARLGISGAITIPNNIPTDVAFDVEAFDTDSYHDNVTNNERITIPEDGIYSIVGSFGFVLNGTGVRIGGILLNGVTPLDSVIDVPTGIFDTAAQVSVIAEFNAGDFIVLNVIQTSGGNLDLVDANTSLSITRIGASGGSGSGGGSGESLDRAQASATLGSTPYNNFDFLVFDTEDFDSNGLIDLGSNNDRITIQEDGLYLVTTQMNYDTSSFTNVSFVSSFIRKNNTDNIAKSEEFAGTSVWSGSLSSTTTNIVNLVAGDYLQVQIRHDGTGTIDTNGTASNPDTLTVIRLAESQGGSGSGGGRELLTANRTYYVATTGSDSNDGLTVGTPFLTIQKAIDVAAALDTSIYDVVIQLADGTYSPSTSIQLKEPIGSGNLTIQGNTGDQSLVIIDGTSLPASTNLILLEQASSNKIRVSFLTIQNTTQDFIRVNANATASTLTLENIDVAGSMGAGRRIFYNIATNSALILEGTFNVDGTSLGTPSSFMEALGLGSLMGGINVTVNMTGSPTFGNACIRAARNNQVNIANMTVTGTFTGTGIGANYSSVIYAVGSSIPNGTSVLNSSVIHT